MPGSKSKRTQSLVVSAGSDCQKLSLKPTEEEAKEEIKDVTGISVDAAVAPGSLELHDIFTLIKMFLLHSGSR